MYHILTTVFSTTRLLLTALSKYVNSITYLVPLSRGKKQGRKAGRQAGRQAGRKEGEREGGKEGRKELQNGYTPNKKYTYVI